jgi:hypothetical protein
MSLRQKSHNKSCVLPLVVCLSHLCIEDIAPSRAKVLFQAQVVLSDHYWAHPEDKIYPEIIEKQKQNDKLNEISKTIRIFCSKPDRSASHRRRNHVWFACFHAQESHALLRLHDIDYATSPSSMKIKWGKKSPTRKGFNTRIRNWVINSYLMRI